MSQLDWKTLRERLRCFSHLRAVGKPRITQAQMGWRGPPWANLSGGAGLTDHRVR
jgi:hypothetical protein